jgi:hypothetical protein
VPRRQRRRCRDAGVKLLHLRESWYCSPGFNLPVGLFQRGGYGSTLEYHTSADDLEFIRPEHLAESARLVVTTLDAIENDRVYLNALRHCEPQPGKRGLYRALGWRQFVACCRAIRPAVRPYVRGSGPPSGARSPFCESCSVRAASQPVHCAKPLSSSSITGGLH